MKLNTSQRKIFRVRNKLKRNSKNNRYRLSVSRSLKNISAQIIDDVNNKTLLSSSSLKKNFTGDKKTASVNRMQEAQNQIFAPEEMTKIDEVVFDRPILFDSHTPHNVIIEDGHWKFPRITASIYFKDEKALDAYV